MLVDLLDKHAPWLSILLVNRPMFIGAALLLLVYALYRGARFVASKGPIDKPKRIWPWQWRKIDQLEMLYLPQWAAVACGYHPNKLATDQHNNLRPWFREFQRVKGAINSGTLLVDGKRITASGTTYIHRNYIAEFYRSQGDLRAAFFPEKRLINALRSRLNVKTEKIEKPEEPSQPNKA